MSCRVCVCSLVCMWPRRDPAHGSPLHPTINAQVLQNALKLFHPITVRLLNYRADGTPFVNDLTVMPIVDRTTNTTSHFLGIVRERPLPVPQRGLMYQPENSSTVREISAAATTSGQKLAKFDHRVFLRKTLQKPHRKYHSVFFNDGIITIKGLRHKGPGSGGPRKA